jgi:hypothetical protein
MGRAVAVVAAFLREVFAREVLPPADPESVARRAQARSGLLHILFGSEPFPQDLPPPPAPVSDGRSALGRLLGPDPLPFDPPLPRTRTGGRWLSWLFAPERLEP